MILRTMQESNWNYKNQEGKGAAGCLLFLLVVAIFVFATIRIWPDYYAYRSLQTEVKTEASRAGANFMEDETVLNNVLQLAKRNEIKLKRENVKVERFAGQVFITVHYTVPIDFIFYTWDMNCDIKASSFIGRL